jgi:truncated hemoglobin YjbI
MASPYRLDSEGNMFETLGRDKIVELSTAFYTRVYTSPNEEFRAMFKNPIEDAIQDQYGAKLYFCDVVCKPSYRLRAAEFFIQRFGGQPLYSERKGTILYGKRAS